MKSYVLVLASITLAKGIAFAAHSDGSFDRSLTVSGPVDLDVKTDSGGIAVTPGSSGSLRIHAILKARRGWFESSDVESRIRELERNPPVEQNGNRIQIGYVRDRNLLKNISMRLEIQTPPDTQIRARADSGGIRVEGIRGPVDCHTDSGGIEIHNIGSDVRAAADSGGIHLTNIDGSAYAHVDSGGIDATQVAGIIDAQADSGGIRVGQTRAAPVSCPGRFWRRNGEARIQWWIRHHAESDSGRISVPEIDGSRKFLASSRSRQGPRWRTGGQHSCGFRQCHGRVTVGRLG